MVPNCDPVPWISDGRKKGQRTCGRQTCYFLQVFLPLISKFLLILTKRKPTPCPYVPIAPAAASVQRQRVEEMFNVWAEGQLQNTPPGHVPGGFGVPDAVLRMWERQERSLVMCSCQEHPKSPREAAAQPLGQQTQGWRTWMCSKRHIPMGIAGRIRACARAQWWGHDRREPTTLRIEFGSCK